MRDKLVIGSRGSDLALTQANLVRTQLEAAHKGLTCHIEIIKTTGDVMREASLEAIAGKGVFTKEIEEALLDERIDIAVHSLKDLPTTLPQGLTISAVTNREDPRDAFVGRPGIHSMTSLPQGARIGTSSPRRRMQLLAWRDDLEVVELRGNVETRLKKIETEGLDGIVIACAGLRRLGLADRITDSIGTNIMVPAVGQGALGIESRTGDRDVQQLVSVLNFPETAACCIAERAFLAAMGGGCAVPIAAHARLLSAQIAMIGVAGKADGTGVRRAEATGSPHAPNIVGQELADLLLDQ